MDQRNEQFSVPIVVVLFGNVPRIFPTEYAQETFLDRFKSLRIASGRKPFAVLAIFFVRLRIPLAASNLFD